MTDWTKDHFGSIWDILMGKTKLEAERVGWTFPVVEISAGAYEVAAVDPKGRARVTARCSESELAATIESVAVDALQLVAESR